MEIGDRVRVKKTGKIGRIVSMYEATKDYPSMFLATMGDGSIRVYHLSHIESVNCGSIATKYMEV